MKYRFITNFKPEEMTAIYIGIKANDITDYVFCKTAKDRHGNIVQGYYALYFGENVTAKERELFWRSSIIAGLKLKEMGTEKNG